MVIIYCKGTIIKGNAGPEWIQATPGAILQYALICKTEVAFCTDDDVVEQFDVE